METVKPLLTQIKLSYFTYDCGMSYVVRLADSRFVLIDGGCDDHEECEHLFDVLCAQNERDDKKIVIAAWLFTHAHDDHIGCFLKFAEKYAGKVEIQKLVYDFVFEASGTSEMQRQKFLRVAPGIAESVTPKTGMRFEFPGVAFEVVTTGREIEEIKNFNETSTVFKMTAGKYSAMFLGDIHGQGAEKILQLHPKEYIKSDILQVAHHGYWGATDELCRVIDPSILLWPCPDYWYGFARTLPQNKYLTESENIISVLQGGQKEYVIDLTDPIKKYDPPYGTYAHGETVYEEHFIGKRIVDLGWSCVTGGNTGYLGADAEIDDGIVLSAENRRSVVEFIPPGMSADAEEFSLLLKGRILSGDGVFGLLWNDAHPRELDEKRVLMFGTEKKDFCYRLERKDGRTVLYSDKEVSRELDDDANKGFYLVLENVKVRLSEVKLIKL